MSRPFYRQRQMKNPGAIILQKTGRSFLLILAALFVVLAPVATTRERPEGKRVRAGTASGWLANAAARRLVSPEDDDGDGVSDDVDNCPLFYNPTRIAFSSTRDGNSEIYVMNSDGLDVTRLPNNPAFDDHPSFRGDGNKIALCLTATATRKFM